MMRRTGLHRPTSAQPPTRPVPLEPLLPLFHRLNREHFDGSLARQGSPLVAVRWSDGRLTRTAGLYRRGRRPDGSDLCEIVLSRPLLEPLPREATLSTLCHEMIHAWVDRVLGMEEVHGPQFRAHMARINAGQQEFQVSIRHRFPVPPRPAAWVAHCPRCGLRSPYRRRREGLACRACCEQLHGGRWHADCLLRFEPAAGGTSARHQQTQALPEGLGPLLSSSDPAICAHGSDGTAPGPRRG